MFSRRQGVTHMLFVENNNRDPYQNHALEEWLMDNAEEDCFMLWRNEKAILLGKNQNAYSEINMPYAAEQGIKIVRRITGGGTVFTDEGNVMFTFISCNGRKDFSDFKRFTEPILQALRRMGVPAEFTGRNDLTIEGRKFSGNAQCRYRDKLLHHGTLMYTANTEELAKALNVRPIKLKSKGVSSVKSRVTNISNYLEVTPEIEEFRRLLFQMVMEETPGAELFRLTPEQWKEVKLRSLEKHATKEWIYGYNPVFDIHKETKLSGGIVEVFLNTKKGRICDAKIYGDFFGEGEVCDIEQELRGVLYEEESIREAIAKYPVQRYFGKIGNDELVTAFI